MSDHFSREQDASKESPSSRAPRPDPIFRIFYLRLVVVVAIMMIVAALMANA